MAVRYLRYNQAGALTTLTRSGPTAIATFDDSKPRKLTGIKASLTTALVHVQLDVAGRVFADIDLSDLNTAEGFQQLDQDFPPGVQFSINVINDSAGTLAANTLEVELRYEAASS